MDAFFLYVFELCKNLFYVIYFVCFFTILFAVYCANLYEFDIKMFNK